MSVYCSTLAGTACSHQRPIPVLHEKHRELALGDGRTHQTAQADRHTGTPDRRDKQNIGTAKPPPAFLRPDACRSGPRAAGPAGSSHVPPPPSLAQPSLRQCEGQPLERAPTSASTSLAVAQASSSPTSPPQPCYPSCRRRIPAIALCCAAQPPHLKDHAGPRNTNHESDNRHTCPALPQVQSLDY